jgi:hypothetical protein
MFDVAWPQAIDSEGYLYTWGGSGHALLGHSDKTMEASVSMLPARLVAHKKALRSGEAGAEP